MIDALPDLSDGQVIVYTDYPRPGAPQVVEDQVTYPLTDPMLSVPKSVVCASRSRRPSGHIIFEDGTDIYWRVRYASEYLNFAGTASAA